MKLYLLVLCILLGVVSSGCPVSAIVYVKWDASGSVCDGSSWRTAYHTIQQGIDAATDGDEVWVAQGLYAERVTMRPDIHLYGGFNGTEIWKMRRDCGRIPTVINAQDESTVAGVVEGADMATVDGFVIRGGYYGLCCHFSSMVIRNNVITGNTSYGVHVSDSAPAILNNIIYDNGGGVFVDARARRPFLVNNTIASNVGYGLNNKSGHLEVSNNIIAFNGTGICSLDQSNWLKLSHNNVYGSTLHDYAGPRAGWGDISADPLFVDLEIRNYHIRPDSPCREAGDNSATMLPAIDIDGQPRVQGARVDIGADESYGEGAVGAVIRVKHDSPVNGPGNDWKNAYRTIGEAMAMATLDDEVWVAAGHYLERIVVKPGVALRGGYTGFGAQRDIRANTTTVDAGSGGGIVISAENSAMVEGFTVRGGSCGVYCASGRPTISRNIISNNSTGGHTGFQGVGVFDSNVFSSNLTGIRCGRVMLETGTAVVTNNVFSGNGDGIDCRMHSRPFVACNTIVDNWFRGVNIAGASPIFINNIVAFNSTGIYIPHISESVIAHNNVFGNGNNYFLAFTPDPTNTSADPCFLNRAGGDYHLTVGSPCIDAGIDHELLPSLDFHGHNRLYGVAVDMGAYEYSPISVEVDILPGESPNVINPKSRGLIAVAVLTTPEFDAADINPATVALAGCPVAMNKSGKLMYEMADVDRDGDLDLILHFRTQELPLTGASSFTLSGFTRDSCAIEGTDAVVVLNK